MALFTSQELIADSHWLAASEPLPIEIARFHKCHFESPSSEEFIVVSRGSKRVFSSGLLFWIQTIQADDWSGREKYFIPRLQVGLCRPISGKERSDGHRASPRAKA